MNPRLLSDQVPWELLGRHFAGELPPDDAETLQRWVRSAPEHAALVEELRHLWSDAPKTSPAWNVDAAVRRVMQPAARPARVIPLQRFYREPDRPVWARALRKVAGVAAVLGVFAGGAWMMAYRSSAATAIAADASEMRTPRGERASLRLPDGSEVILGPASVLRYAIARDHGPRVVELEGEAYFSVTHDEARPFTVHTAHAVATDLGTEFGVRAHARDSVVQVVVREGKVGLARAAGAPVPEADGRGSEVVLVPQDLGVVTAGGRVYAEHDVDVAAHLAWTEGRLELREVPLRDAVVQLSRWYDLDIQLRDGRSDGRRITATFQHESGVDALRLIAATLELGIDVHDNVVILWTP